MVKYSADRRKLESRQRQEELRYPQARAAREEMASLHSPGSSRSCGEVLRYCALPKLNRISFKPPDIPHPQKWRRNLRIMLPRMIYFRQLGPVSVAPISQTAGAAAQARTRRHKQPCEGVGDCDSATQHVATCPTHQSSRQASKQASKQTRDQLDIAACPKRKPRSQRFAVPLLLPVSATRAKWMRYKLQQQQKGRQLQLASA